MVSDDYRGLRMRTTQRGFISGLVVGGILSECSSRSSAELEIGLTGNSIRHQEVFSETTDE